MATDILTIQAGDIERALLYHKELVAVGKVTHGQINIVAWPTMRRDPYGYGVWLATTGDAQCLVLNDGYYGIDDMLACLRGYLSQPARNQPQYDAAHKLLADLQRL